MQPPNANNKENIAILISRIKGEKYLVKKTQAADIRKKELLSIKRRLYIIIKLFKYQYSCY